MSSTRRLILAELVFSLTVFALQKIPRGWGGTTLALALGTRGIIVTNIVLQALTAALARSIAQLIAGRFAGLAAALLYLSLPFIAHQVFTRGVTDLAPVVLLLAALRFADERPATA